MKIKYLLLPGTIKAIKDGDHHFIGFMRLIGLHLVAPAECIMYEPGRTRPKDYAKLIKLYPREDGKYYQTPMNINEKEEDNIEIQNKIQMEFDSIQNT